jgi:DHA3 family macrolide efflux protein-like MFS transporter
MKLLMNKNLALLLSGQFVSQIGDKFYMLALAIWVLDTTNSPAMMGGVLFCSFFPTFLMGFIAGAVVDKYDRKIIIVAADFIRGLVIAVVTCLYYLNLLNIHAIFISQILLSVCAAFFNPAIPAVIPQVIDKSQLARANSMTSFVRGFTSMLGPVLGGIAVATLGYAAVFAFNALSFVISAAFECFLEIPRHQNKQIERAGIIPNVLEGLKYIFQFKKLIIILIMVAIIHFFVGSIEVLIPVFSSQLAGTGAKNLGYIQTFFGLGTVLAALMISFYNINGKEVRLLFGGVFAFGTVCLVIAYVSIWGINSVMHYLAPFLLLGSFIILAATCFRTILQKNVENEMAGRVFGAAGTIGDISIPIAMLTYGFLLRFLSCSWLLATTGFFLMLLSGLFYRSYRHIDLPEKGHLVIDPEFHG